MLTDAYIQIVYLTEKTGFVVVNEGFMVNDGYFAGVWWFPSKEWWSRNNRHVSVMENQLHDLKSYP